MANVVRQIIVTAKAPIPLAPYNQAIKVGNTLYLSGVIGMDKNTKKIVEGGIEAETRQVMHNLQAVLEAAGSGLNKLIKTTIMLNDINDFAVVNEIYRQHIKENFPARSTYQVGKLPLGALVEIEAIALSGVVTTETLSEL